MPRTVEITRTDGGTSVMTILDDAVSVEEEIAKWQGVHPDAYQSHRVREE
jgi:hypothetical protein